MTSLASISCFLVLGLAGVESQPLLAGEKTCEGSQLTKAACVAISCCEWEDGRCWWKGVECPATTTATTAKPTKNPATTAKPTKKPATTVATTRSSPSSCSA